MSRIYLDTSAIIPIYREEPTTEIVLNTLSSEDEFIISNLTRVEFRSAFYRAVRSNEITIETARHRIEMFEADLANYSMREITPITWECSKDLLDRYSTQTGLRTLDSLHLATAVEVAKISGLDFFLTLDEILAKVARLEGLEVKP